MKRFRFKLKPFLIDIPIGRYFEFMIDCEPPFLWSLTVGRDLTAYMYSWEVGFTRDVDYEWSSCEVTYGPRYFYLERPGKSPVSFPRNRI